MQTARGDNTLSGERIVVRSLGFPRSCPLFVVSLLYNQQEVYICITTQKKLTFLHSGCLFVDYGSFLQFELRKHCRYTLAWDDHTKHVVH